MSRIGLLHSIIAKSRVGIHKTRLNALLEAVDSLINGAHLTLTDLGRHIRNQTTPKYNIKKVDRLLSNNHLQRETTQIYHALTQNILKTMQQLVIIIDVCCIKDHHQCQSIRASIAIQGRALTLYELPYTKERLKSSHLLFLQRLSEILPKNLSIVLVCDAGFKASWFEKIESYGWDWVGRIRKKSQKILYHNSWYDPEILWDDAASQPKLIGQVKLAKQHQLDCQLISYRKPLKGRTKKNRNGQKCLRRESQEYSRQAREPWLLATSLKCSAREVVNIYKKRMQIEESFRDLKSHRFGLGARYAGTKDIKRWSILLLIANLGVFLLWLIGQYARACGYEKRYQSNTRSYRKEFSDIFLGLLVTALEPIHIYRNMPSKQWRQYQLKGIPS